MYSTELGINFFGNKSNKKRKLNKIEILKKNIHNFKIFLVIAGTNTSQIPGISAAGINAKSRRKTALADAEFLLKGCLLYTSPSPRDRTRSRMPSSA